MAQPRPVSRAHRGLVLAAALALVALTACSNGVEAGTLDETAWTGARLDAGDLRIHNAVLVAGDDGTLSVSMTVINTGGVEDTLNQMVIIGGDEPVPADLRPASIAFAPGATLLDASAERPSIQVDADVSAGQFASVTFGFERAGTVSASLLVVSAGSPHAGGEQA